MGMALFQITRQFKSRNTYALLAVLACFCIYLQGYVRNSFYDFMYLIYFMMLIHSLALMPRSKKIPVLTMMGETSYSFYLIHAIIIIIFNQLMKKYTALADHPLLLLCLFLVSAQISAWIIYKWVELPGRAFVQKFAQKQSSSNFKL